MATTRHRSNAERHKTSRLSRPEARQAFIRGWKEHLLAATRRPPPGEPYRRRLRSSAATARQSIGSLPAPRRRQTDHAQRAIDAKGCADGSIITACRRRYSIPLASQANGAMKDDRIFQQLGTERHGKRRRKSLLVGLDGRSGTIQAPPERPAALRCPACPFFAGTLFHGLSKNRSRLRLPASRHAKSEYVA